MTSSARWASAVGQRGLDEHVDDNVGVRGGSGEQRAQPGFAELGVAVASL